MVAASAVIATTSPLPMNQTNPARSARINGRTRLTLNNSSTRHPSRPLLRARFIPGRLVVPRREAPMPLPSGTTAWRAREGTVTDLLHNFLSSEEIAAIRAPIEPASPFPNVAYTSQPYFDLEVDRVFARNWVAVGLAPSLPGRGDARLLRIFGFPILLLRDGEGGNIGAHYGCPVVEEPASGLTRLVGAGALKNGELAAPTVLACDVMGALCRH
jgi:hypothetical protein